MKKKSYLLFFIIITFFIPCYAQDVSLDALLKSINTKGYISKTQSEETNKNNDVSLPLFSENFDKKKQKYIDTTNDHNGHYVRDESDLYDANNIKIPMGYEKYKLPVSKNIQIILFSFHPKESFKKSYEKYFNPNYISQQIPLPNLPINKILDYFTYRGDVKILDNYTNTFTYEQDISIKLNYLKGNFKIIENDSEVNKILFNINYQKNIKGLLLTKDNFIVMTPISTGDTNILLTLRIF